jgi:hypothetical protein
LAGLFAKTFSSEMCKNTLSNAYHLERRIFLGFVDFFDKIVAGGKKI